jgi:predicted RNA-binding Zn-ribbon protein involved in translation (DUF1610 family)
VEFNKILSENPCPYCGKNEWIPWSYRGRKNAYQLGTKAIVDIKMHNSSDLFKEDVILILLDNIKNSWIDECTSCGAMVCL